MIVDRLLVKELIQKDLNINNLRQALSEILIPQKAAEIKTGYAELREKLGNAGASARAAKVIIQFLRG